MKILISQILPNPEQPRKEFKKDELDELANSMRQNGLLNAVPVEGPFQEGGKDFYFLVDGERRWRAAQLLGWETIEATVLAPIQPSETSTTRLLLALTANLQRSDMQPIEEAQAFQRLRGMGMSVTKIAHQLGTYSKRISDRLRLLDLDGEIQDLVNGNNLPADIRVAEALLSIPDQEARLKTARRLARPGITIKVIQGACTNVRETLRQASNEVDIPATYFGKQKYHKDERRSIPNWDMTRLLGKTPPWEVVREACRKTCDTCALREAASEKNCGDCPAVQMVKLMLIGVDQTLSTSLQGSQSSTLSPAARVQGSQSSGGSHGS